jgi:AICAR transformylase/IMP cyclohydrolase PurH
MKAVISVFDKIGVVEFAKALHDQGMELLATEGTARVISARGIPVTRVSDFTSFPELLGGKVKTLHPRIHAAIATGEIRIVVVNLIPLESASKKSLDKMDIGGVAKPGVIFFSCLLGPERTQRAIRNPRTPPARR